MLRPVYGKNIVYHCLRQGNRIACFRVKLMETINKNWVPKNGYYCFTRLFLGVGVPLHKLHKLDRWVPLFYVPETFGETATCFPGIWNSPDAGCHLRPWHHLLTTGLGFLTSPGSKNSYVGGQVESSPGWIQSAQTKWLVLRMIHGSRIPGSYQMGKPFGRRTDFLGKFYLVNSWGQAG